MAERSMKEVAFLKERFNRVERNEKDLNELIIKNAEENNEKKIQLETDVQVRYWFVSPFNSRLLFISCH